MENLEAVIDELNAWNDQGRFAEVVVESDTHLASEQNESSLYVVRGNALFGLGRFEEALKAYEEAIKIDTFDVQARTNYGSTLFSLGRYVDALNACDAAILTDEEFAPAYINAAHCLTALGHEDDAVYALSQAYSLNKEDMELGRTVAAMAADLGEYDMARDVYFDMSGSVNAPDDLPELIHHFFVAARQNGAVDRTQVLKDVDIWRQQYGRNPAVLRLSAELLKG